MDSTRLAEKGPLFHCLKSQLHSTFKFASKNKLSASFIGTHDRSEYCIVLSIVDNRSHVCPKPSSGVLDTRNSGEVSLLNVRVTW